MPPLYPIVRLGGANGKAPRAGPGTAGLVCLVVFGPGNPFMSAGDVAARNDGANPEETLKGK
jgi:hypothetical protein